MALVPLNVAWWRFEQIAPLLDSRLTAAERRRLMEAMSRTPVQWPSGRVEPVKLSTLYDWLRRYRQNPVIESLMPVLPKETPVCRAIKPEWVQYALALLEEEPQRSLYILTLRIRDNFGLVKAPSRASLHRALHKERRYVQLRRRASGEKRLRVMFAAINPHEIWHTDAKAYYEVRFVDGSRKKVRILSILDDATRFVLRALVVLSESTAAAVATFREAAARWGLPDKLYVDRGSPYDSTVFRKGLAVLGIHRINTKPRNASAHGKIEALNRLLQRWFITELAHQLVLDLRHLQELLDAVIDQWYHQHVHRELKKTPQQAFGNTMSSRTVSLERLQYAFLEEKQLLPHKKNGAVRVGGVLFKIPNEFLVPRRKVTIALDVQYPGTPYLVIKPGVLKPLKPAVHKAGGSKASNADDMKNRKEPVGSLTPLLEKYRGRTLPQARAGFGLPEIYQHFSKALNRDVPATEHEADTIMQWLKDYGPFDPDIFASNLKKIIARLGATRPLAQIIEAITEKISKNHGKEGLQ